jgi:SAM-dependent methyltransferase
MIRDHFKPVIKRVLPPSLRKWLRRIPPRVLESPKYKLVNFGSLRRVIPIHRGFDIGRGTYVDRYYIEKFLASNSPVIRGRVLELADNDYSLRFGGTKVTHSDILDIRPDYPRATIIADLSKGDAIPSDIFDCVLLVQTLNVIYDVQGAIRTIYRILKPGGCVLVSVPGISQIVPAEMEYCGDYWRFTQLSLERLFEEVFPPENTTVESRGNVLAAIAFLHGLAAEELSNEELDFHDPDFEVSILLKAVKPIR